MSWWIVSQERNGECSRSQITNECIVSELSGQLVLHRRRERLSKDKRNNEMGVTGSNWGYIHYRDYKSPPPKSSMHGADIETNLHQLRDDKEGEEEEEASVDGD